MFKLEIEDYKKITNIVKSNNELSVFSVISGIIPGEIFVNNTDNPTATLIQTSECNLIAGKADDEAFNSEVSSKLDFWDPLTPDSEEWIDKIPYIHKNKFIRKYKRRHYTLSANQFIQNKSSLMNEFTLERVDLKALKEKSLENADRLLVWISNWGKEENYNKYGAGHFIHNNKTIVSWSLSDCSHGSKIAIGVHTEERYRNKGFGKIVVSENIKSCFDKGYETVEWLCVDSNKGSIAIAEKLGFKQQNDYLAFSSYPPIENVTDLTETQWHEWAEYLENSCKNEDRLIWECLFSYIKSNDVVKTIDVLGLMQQKQIAVDYSRIESFVNMLKLSRMCSNFSEKPWVDFLNKFLKK